MLSAMLERACDFSVEYFSQFYLRLKSCLKSLWKGHSFKSDVVLIVEKNAGFVSKLLLYQASS